MTRWEYRLASIGNLGELGDQGWEAYAVTSPRCGEVIYHLRRPLPDDGGEASALLPLIRFASIADRIGVSAQRVRQLSQHAGFPAPLITSDGTRLYKVAEIEAYDAARNHQGGRPRK